MHGAPGIGHVACTEDCTCTHEYACSHMRIRECAYAYANVRVCRVCITYSCEDAYAYTNCILHMHAQRLQTILR